jgi:4-methyl-5(b-hydroxyethyl)-thiazole monophosphate biosynthesis
MKKILIPIANGTEELEAVTLIDLLRRAEFLVTVASVNELTITASRKTKIQADCLITDCMAGDFDLIALPGGMPGAENLRDSLPLTSILKKHFTHHKPLAAICAAPAVVLHAHHLLYSKATCYPSFKGELTRVYYINQPVVVDENIVTAAGPGAAIEFALTLINLLAGEEKRDSIAQSILV